MLSPETESRIMFSQSVLAHAEMPLNERVEDRSTVPAENGAAGTIEELRIHHCRWRLGAVHAKPPLLYCGERPEQNLAKGETVVSALAEVPDAPVTAS